MSQTTFRPVHLRCDCLENPIGFGDPRPRLSWQINADHRRAAAQSAFQILVSSQPGGPADLWDSGRVKSTDSSTPYSGKPLKSRQRAWWLVRTWDEAGRQGESIEQAFWEAGLITRAEWKAQWICGPITGGRWTTAPAPYLRKPVFIPQRIVRARLYATALGLYEPRINGRCISRASLAPGWTDYRKRVQYQTYDVTDALVVGENVLGAILGDGWYCGHIGEHGRQMYGDRPKFFAQLMIDYPDGHTDIITTDATWRLAYGPILENDLLMGESFDARLDFQNWDKPGFDERGWQAARIVSVPTFAIDPMRGPPVVAVMDLPALKLPTAKQTGRLRTWLCDFGQNISGRIRFTAKGIAGATLTLRHAEVLNDDGSLNTAGLRTARATDHYTLRGDTSGETWEPRFTCHGFRYAEISSRDPAVEILSATAVALQSDAPLIGDFSCNDTLLNQLQRGIVWTQRAALLDVPQEAPQRDERFARTDSALLALQGIVTNFDVSAFSAKWMQDVSDAQLDNGGIAPAAPAVSYLEKEGGAAASDAMILCPWLVYVHSGNPRILENHYASMTRFADHCIATAPKHIRRPATGQEWRGDRFASETGDSAEGRTPQDFIGTAYLAHSLRTLSRIARVLGNKPDEKKYDTIADEVVAAFQREFVTPEGRIACSTQTACLLALHFNLLPPKLRTHTANDLIRDIEHRGNKFSVGDIGASLILPVLTSLDRTDLAYKLLHQKEAPSWVRAIIKGATTLGEGFSDQQTAASGHSAPACSAGAGTSFGSWLYTTIAGITPDEDQPGYRHFLLAPHPGGKLTSAKARIASPYGEISSAWRITSGRLIWDVHIPANTSATVRFPCGFLEKITVDGKALVSAPGISKLKQLKSSVSFKLAAGRYEFSAFAK